MHKLLFFPFIFLFTLFSNGWSSDTFVIDTYQTDINHSVEQTTDAGFIVSGTNRVLVDENWVNETILFKTDSDGVVSWSKAFAGSNSGPSTVRLVKDEGYILLTTVSEEDQYSVLLIRTDLNGDTVWTKSFSGAIDNPHPNVIATSDDGFLLTFEKNSQIALLKVNSSGETVWEKALLMKTSFRKYRIDIFELSTGGYLFSSLRQTIKYSIDGTELFSKEDINAGFAGVFSDGNFIFLLTSRKFIKTNSMGDILWEKDLASTNIPAIQKLVVADDNMVIVGSDVLIKTDSSANVLNEKETEFDLNNGTALTNSFIFSGEESPSGILYKTDSNLLAKYIILTSPENNSILRRDEQTTISWKSDGVDNINIDISYDDGVSWENIVTSLLAADGSYDWHTPGVFNNEIIVRVSSSSEPDIFDQNEQPVSIHAKDYDYITTNQILMWFANNGDGSHDPFTDGNGFYWPGGINATQSAIFEDGLCWGGIVGDSVRVNGDTHREGLQPGNILSDGKAANPDDPQFGVWRANPSWQTFPEGPEKERMEYDWNNWPAHLGAPWEDNDGNGEYDPSVDNPKIDGDEAFWMVMNDMDTTTSRFTYGADPIGLEIQLSVYAYNREILEDVIFKKYKMLNKGENLVDDMYFSYWSDIDLGGAGDDYMGFDTLLNLAYGYNDDDNDAMYQGPVPAVGYLLLQGPVVPATEQDSAYANGEWVWGFRNEKMVSSAIYIGASAVNQDPSQGEIEGSYMFYNNMQGNTWNGFPIIDPNTGEEMRFAVPGDPVIGSGWYEGAGWPGGPASGDRRGIMSSGPFDFAPGDSQEVVYAIVIARGSNYLDSVTKLKEKAAAVRDFYYTGVFPTAIEDEVIQQPKQYSLSQNYPNPFNPTTTINYQLPTRSNVKLIIYDVLGRRVKTLIDKRQNSGLHKVIFDASSLASGIYYYKLKADPSTGSGQVFEKTNKMLLLR